MLYLRNFIFLFVWIGIIICNQPLLVKYESSSGSRDFKVSSIREHSEDRYVFCGYTDSGGDYEGLIGMTDSMGNIIWVKYIYQININLRLTTVAVVDTDSNVICGGTSQTASTEENPWIVKFSPENGEVLFQMMMDFASTEEIVTAGLGVDTSDNSIYFSFYHRPSDVRNHILTKFSSDGSKLWYGIVTDNDEEAIDLHVIDGEGVVVLGDTQNYDDGGDHAISLSHIYANGTGQYWGVVLKSDVEEIYPLFLTRVQDGGYLVIGMYDDGSMSQQGMIVKFDGEDPTNFHWAKKFQITDPKPI